MLKVSSKGRYGLRALGDLAFHGPGAPAQIRDIARRQRIPMRFLEQIFQELRRAGLVGSKRGPRGGYILARPPSEICVGDVLRAVESVPVRGRPVAAPRELREITEQILEDLARDVDECLNKVTLADICARGKAAGILPGGAAPAYVI